VALDVVDIEDVRGLRRDDPAEDPLALEERPMAEVLAVQPEYRRRRSGQAGAFA
jgi:hypothetical protein